MSVPPDGGSPSGGEPRFAPHPQTDANEDADVHAFLIADVRGYTAFTQERGDEGAARLAGRFAEVTRSVVEGHRGRVLELRGDEALVVFGSPRAAIRGAVALQRRFVEETIADPSLPLTVGIGLDAGEAVAIEGGYRGGALNVAARLCSHARAGEVLASREIVHLARRVDGIRLTERGEATMKGLDRPVHVVAVRSEDRDAAEAIAPFVRSTPPPSSRYRRWKVVGAAVAFAVLAAVIAVPLIAHGRSEIEPNSIGLLDPASGEVTSTIELKERPGAVAASADAVWVTHPDARTITRIDPTDLEIRDTIPVGEDPTGIAVGFDTVWVLASGGPSVSRINPETGQAVGRPIAVGNGPAGIAVGEGSVWVTNRFDGTISRIDPDPSEAVKSIPVGPEPGGIAVGFGSVWVGLAGSNTVVRVDPETNSVAQSIGVGNAPGVLAVSANAVWVANTLDDTVSRIDPDTSTVKGLVQVGDGPSGITVVDGIVWVANGSDGTLSRIEPGDAPVRTLAIGSVPQGLIGVNGEPWVSVRGTATSHRGGTLRLASTASYPSLDPGVNYADWRVMHLLGDGLLAFEPIGGTSSSLVPDLAISVPTPVDGGRTYTFQLRRPSVRYSNAEVVAPADFRWALERGFNLNPGAYESLFSGLLGGDECVKEPRTCDLAQGVVTDDVTGTITFHLVAPDPEFLYKLTLPFTYPVPPSTPGEPQHRSGVPGTGPYMLEALKTRKGLALMRNPYFRVWSPTSQPDGYADRIEWTFSLEPEVQIDAVLEGEADVAFDAAFSPRFQEISVQFAAQVRSFPAPETWFWPLNTEVQPFDDVDVRRAVNLALDRRRVVQILGGETAVRATCQQLPPNFQGYEPYCPYTMNPGPEGEGSWTGPDLEGARELVRRSDTAGMRIVIEYPAGPVPQSILDYMVELLDELGYRGSSKLVSESEFFSSGNEFNMAPLGWLADYPAASTFISSWFTCDSPLTPNSRFCDPAIDAMIERAERVQVEDPGAAGALWHEIDREIVDQAPFLWLVNPMDTAFVSERVGNYQTSLQWGVLLNQLWVT